jgi:hypothetical protein
MRGSECLSGPVSCVSGFGGVIFSHEFHAGSNLQMACQFDWNLAEAVNTVWCEKWGDRNLF